MIASRFSQISAFIQSKLSNSLILFLLVLISIDFGMINGTERDQIRPKRQFARYICGIPPYIFHSDWPCPMWGLCANHGFTTNLPCANHQTCLERNPGTECVQGTCCTLPSVVTPPASADGQSSTWPGTQTWPGSSSTKSAKSAAGQNANRLSQIAFLFYFLIIFIFFYNF